MCKGEKNYSVGHQRDAYPLLCAHLGGSSTNLPYLQTVEVLLGFLPIPEHLGAFDTLDVIGLLYLNLN